MSDARAAMRPGPGAPRSYAFPRAAEHRTANGLRILALSMPGRPLAALQLLFHGGAAAESPAESGLIALLAKLLTEGGDRHDADGLVEAAELLGASIGAEAGWERVAIGAEVPVARIAPLLDLVAEIALSPRLPEREVERLKALRLAAIEQAHASPRTRATEALLASIYADGAAYGRPPGGTRESVAVIDRDALLLRHARLLVEGEPLLVVAGELRPDELFAAVEASPLATLRAHPAPPPAGADRPAPPPAPGNAPRVALHDRPGSVQSELRIGRLGRSRLAPGFHAALVHSEIVGGLFGSRLNRVLREERGYTYGAGAGFDFRRGRGPFTMRTAVESSVTAPALAEARRQLSSPLTDPVTAEELDAARDYLRGTFPLRFGAAPPVVATVAGLTAVGLPLSDLDEYREAVAAVDAAAVRRVAEELESESERIVVVGDASIVAGPLRDEGFDVEVIPDAAATA